MSRVVQRLRRFTPESPHSLARRAVALIRERYGPFWPAAEVRTIFDDLYAEFADLIATRLTERGYPPEDIGPWLEPPVVCDECGLREAALAVQHALRFRAHGVPVAEAVEWWARFTSPATSLSYRAVGHTPSSAEAVWAVVRSGWMWADPPKPDHMGLDAWMAERAHRWTLTGMSAGRIERYVRLNIGPREATRDWERRPDCDEVIGFMLALSGSAG